MLGQKLVLAGGGHAMLPSLLRARDWIRNGLEVTLVDPHPYLYYSGMVPEYLGGVYRQEEVRIDLRRLCKKAGIDYVQGRVAAVDALDRQVTTSDGTALPYDLLAVDIGGVNPNPPAGVIPSKPITETEALARHIRATLSDAAASLSLAIVGGGAAGVEVALNVTARFESAGRSADLELTILEARPDLLPSFPAGLRTDMEARLHRRGIQVLTGVKASRIQNGTITTSGAAPSVHADAIFWATGAVGPDLFARSGLPTDDDGFVRADPTLQVEDSNRIFAAGDCATLTGYEDLAKVGVHAVKQGPVLRRNLERSLRQIRLEGKPAGRDSLTAFRPYPATPLILSTGIPEGIWTTGSVWWSGASALRLKHWIDRRWMQTYNPAWDGRPMRRLADTKAAARRSFKNERPSPSSAVPA